MLTKNVLKIVNCFKSLHFYLSLECHLNHIQYVSQFLFSHFASNIKQKYEKKHNIAMYAKLWCIINKK